MTRFLWPDPKALLDELAELMAEGGAAMQVAAPERIAAGIGRARPRATTRTSTPRPWRR